MELDITLKVLNKINIEPEKYEHTKLYYQKNEEFAYFIELTDIESAEREVEWEKYLTYFRKSKSKKFDLPKAKKIISRYY